MVTDTFPSGNSLIPFELKPKPVLPFDPGPAALLDPLAGDNFPGGKYLTALDSKPKVVPVSKADP